VINVRLPPDLDRAIARVARQRRMTTSQAVRTLLRAAVGLVDHWAAAGWQEGLTAGEAAFWRAHADQASRAARTARKG